MSHSAYFLAEKSGLLHASSPALLGHTMLLLLRAALPAALKNAMCSLRDHLSSLPRACTNFASQIQIYI